MHLRPAWCTRDPASKAEKEKRSQLSCLPLGNVWERGKAEGGKRLERTEPETDLQHVGGGLEGTAGAVMENGRASWVKSFSCRYTENSSTEGVALDWRPVTSPAVEVGVAERVSEMLSLVGGSGGS